MEDICTICGRKMIPGITVSGTLECYRFGYERSQAALAAANARAEKAEAHRDRLRDAVLAGIAIHGEPCSRGEECRFVKNSRGALAAPADAKEGK